MDIEHEPGAGPVLADHEAVDDHHNKIGMVTDVIFDEREAKPRWATVKMGMLSGEHFVPLDGSYVAEDGTLVLAYDRETVKHAPRVPHDHVLTREVEEELVEHYELASH